MKYSVLKFKLMAAVMLAVAAMAASCSHDDAPVKEPDKEENATPEEPSAEMVLERMTLEEKVAQMFIVDPEHLSASSPCTGVDSKMSASLRDCPVGGIIFFGANIKDPAQTKRFVSDIKSLCKYPPFIAVDEEGGKVARIANNSNFTVMKFSPMLEVGKTGDPANAYEVGSVIGGYLSVYGFNVDFAPVADIYSNPANTVIGARSFGTTAEVVSPMVAACVEGLHSRGVFATLKHFPGHGDTDTDSHTSLPLVTKTWDELLKSEIVPFKQNFDKADMIMTAHIAVTDVNETINGNTVPSTLSHNMLTGKLRGELGYDGIIITDALRMAGITNFCATQAEAAVMAIQAGVDIILCPGNFLEPDGTYNAVLQAVMDGRIPEERINQSLRRIIKLKNKMK